MKQKWRPDEDEEHEHHRSQEQDEKLHRNLRHRVEQKAEPALCDRLSGKVPLHLALIGPEVSERKKHAADEPAPEVVAIAPVDGRGYGVQPACCARDL